jgi:hypothetical protein
VGLSDAMLGTFIWRTSKGLGPARAEGRWKARTATIQSRGTNFRLIVYKNDRQRSEWWTML